MADEKRPDRPHAILFPTGWRPPSDTPFPGTDRADRLITFFEGILGGDRRKTPAYIRQVAGGPRHMVSLDPRDTLYYPTGHEREKMDRYDHEEQPNGLTYLYLKDENDSPGITPAAMARASADMAKMQEQTKATEAKMLRFFALKDRDDLTDEEVKERGDLWRELKTLSEAFNVEYGQSTEY